MEDEESVERREEERKLREKEASYQRRLQKWEDREVRKSREIEARKRREEERREDEEKEAIRLKIFLQDYDDDRDDAKYYRSKILVQRLKERRIEMEEDERDRRGEKRELEELRRKLIEEGHPETEPVPRKEEARSLIDRLVSAARDGIKGDGIKSDGVKSDETSTVTGTEEGVPIISFPGMRLKTESTSPKLKDHKRHPDIFNSQEEDEASTRKKRRLPVLEDDDSMSSQSRSNDQSRFISSEEKKKQIKEIIEEIPTTKEELFKFPIDWTMVDSVSSGFIVCDLLISVC